MLFPRNDHIHKEAAASGKLLQPRFTLDLGIPIAMHNAHLPRPVAHALDKVQQVVLIGMGAIAANGDYIRLNQGIECLSPTTS